MSRRAQRILAPSPLAEHKLRRFVATLPRTECRGFWKGVAVMDGQMAAKDLSADDVTERPSAPGRVAWLGLSTAAHGTLTAGSSSHLARYLRAACAVERRGFWSGVFAMDGQVSIDALAAGLHVQPTKQFAAPATITVLGSCLECGAELPEAKATGRPRLYHDKCKTLRKRRAQRQRLQTA